MQVVSMGRKKFRADFQLMFRLLKLFLFIGFIGILGILFTLLNLTVGDIFDSLFAFLPTGWALLQVTITKRLLFSLQRVTLPPDHAGGVVGADIAGAAAGDEGAGAVGLRQGLGSRVRVRDGSGDLCAGGRPRLVPLRVRVPNQAALQPGLQPRAADIAHPGRREKA